MGQEEEETQPGVLPLTQRPTSSTKKEVCRELCVQSQSRAHLLPTGAMQLEGTSGPSLFLSEKRTSRTAFPNPGVPGTKGKFLVVGGIYG